MSDLRIISLVPSVTELVCDLGLAHALVGRTGFCIHPWETVRHIPKVGGTKDLRFDRIRELAPTHVIVNVDENRREDAEALAEFVPHVVVTHPLGPEDNPALYRQLGAAFGADEAAERLCQAFETALGGLRARLAQVPRPTERVIYLIWRDPWMTVAADTYIARTLGLIGWTSVGGGARGTSETSVTSGASGASGAERYPQIDLGAHAGEVDRVLLSSEPFHFKAEHIPEVQALVPGAQVQLIDGEMTSWYGSRAISAMSYLGELVD